MIKVLLIFITLLPRAYIVCSGTPSSRSGADLGVIPGENAGVNHSANTGWSPSMRPVEGLRTSVGAGLGTHLSQGIGTPLGQGTRSDVGQGARTDVGLGARPVLGPGSRHGVGQGASSSMTLGARPKVRLGAGLGTGGGVGLDALPNVSPGIRHGVGPGASLSMTPAARPNVRLGAGLGTGVGLGALPGASIGGGNARNNPVAGTVVDVGISKDSRGGMISRDGTNAEVNVGSTGVFSLGKSPRVKVSGGAVEPINSATRVSASLGGAGLGGAFQKAQKSPGKGLAKVPKPNYCFTSGYFNRFLPLNCVCIFAGACDFRNVPNGKIRNAQLLSKNLVGFAPTGMEKFAVNDKRVGAVCEKNVVATLFDCNARISLYAATVIHGRLAHGPTDRPSDHWTTTNDRILKYLNKDHIANSNDYKGSGCLIDCFKDKSSSNFKSWDGSLCSNSNNLPSTTSIDKGHMISARYGTGNREGGARVTTTFTNAVPQVGSFNRGAWNAAEKKVMKRTKNCQKKAQGFSLNAQMFVVVGVIPSRKSNQKRFFGKAGFSNFQSPEYRILFPEIMWTAGCCLNSDGTFIDKFAFWGNNVGNDYYVKTYADATSMFDDLKNKVENFISPTVFPAVPECN